MRGLMAKVRFKAVLVRKPGSGVWTYVLLPQRASASFGTRGRVRVRGTINGHPIETTALPRGDGAHYLVVRRAVREAIAAVPGDTVRVVLEQDLGPVRLRLPRDVRQALEANPESLTRFESLPPRIAGSSWSGLRRLVSPKPASGGLTGPLRSCGQPVAGDVKQAELGLYPAVFPEPDGVTMPESVVDRLRQLRDRQLRDRDPLTKQRRQDRGIARKQRQMRQSFSLSQMWRDIPHRWRGAFVGLPIGLIVLLAVPSLIEGLWGMCLGVAAMLFAALVGFLIGRYQDSMDEIRDHLH